MFEILQKAIEFLSGYPQVVGLVANLRVGPMTSPGPLRVVSE